VGGDDDLERPYLRERIPAAARAMWVRGTPMFFKLKSIKNEPSNPKQAKTNATKPKIRAMDFMVLQ
jgi:hypothetical protein